MNTQSDLTPKELRPLLHAGIDKLRDEGLARAHHLLLELDEAADAAHTAGRLSPERIADAVAAHRAAHPYQDDGLRRLKHE